MKWIPFFTMAVGVLLFPACQNQQQQVPSLNGTWESVGSGWLLEVEDSRRYTLYDITETSCTPRREASLEELLESITLKDDTLSLKKGVITYFFTPKDHTPNRCESGLSETEARDPILNFEVFAQTVREHYAFMEPNRIDWDEVYEKQKKKMIEDPTEVRLYQVISETLEILGDNHGYIEATEEVYQILEAEEEAGQQSLETTTDSRPEIGDFQVAQRVAEHHLETEMTRGSSLIQWGTLTDGLGYIQIKAMWLFAELDIPENLIAEKGYVDAYVDTFSKMYEGDYIAEEVRGVSRIMDRVLEDLSEMDAIVIDIRFNGGGQDAVSFEILNRFVSQPTQIAVQKLKFRDTFSPLLPLHLKGTATAFTRPVYVLTSQQTGSAAEAFSIATLSLPHFKRIGSATSGALSTALEKKLPNGWDFALSNEIYMDTKGKSYENIGIPVDYNLEYPKDRQVFFRSVFENLEADKATIMKAIDSLKGDLSGP